jgi:hypothetical protein
MAASTEETMVAAMAFDADEIPDAASAPLAERDSGHPLQPHQWEDRPPFSATHELLTLSPAEGPGWQEQRHALMVIDGLAYSEDAWETRELPAYDVDATGTWWDLELDRVVDRDHQPMPLPARYVGWQDATETPRVIAVEPGGVREVDVFPEDGRSLAQCLVEDACPAWHRAMGGVPRMQAISESLSSAARWEISAETIRGATLAPPSIADGEPSGDREDENSGWSAPQLLRSPAADPVALLQNELVASMSAEVQELRRDGARWAPAQSTSRWDSSHDIEAQAEPTHASMESGEVGF